MEALGDELLAASRLPFDQHREGRGGELGDLAAQFFHRRARADELRRLGRGLRPCAVEGPLQRGRVGRLGDELPGAERPRVARVRRLVLARQHEDLHRRRVGEEIGDQAEPLFRRVRRRRQAEVDQRERRHRRKLAHQLDRPVARLDREHFVVRAQGEGERVGDERVVVDDEELRLGGVHLARRLIGHLIFHARTS
jgi:hypothetical protein